MRIDPRIERPTREMLEYAIRGDLEDLATAIQAAGDEIFTGSIALCVTASGYVAADVSGRWPTDADVHQIARSTVEGETRLDLRESDICDYLSRAVLGIEPMEKVFPLETAYSLPVMITGSLLFTFRPRGQKWWDYLDTIWAATETALAVDLTVLPALTFRARRPPVLEPH